MELNINSPSYFTKQYGVIDEIYSMCRGISKHVEIDYKQFCEDIFQYCKLINLPIESNLKV